MVKMYVKKTSYRKEDPEQKVHVHHVNDPHSVAVPVLYDCRSIECEEMNDATNIMGFDSSTLYVRGMKQQHQVRGIDNIINDPSLPSSLRPLSCRS